MFRGDLANIRAYVLLVNMVILVRELQIAQLGAVPRQLLELC